MVLTRSRRLDKNEFREIFKEGRIIESGLFRIKFLPNQIKLSRFGVVVSSKNFKKAVLRNKLKRQISEIIRLNIAEIKTGFNVIVFIRPEVLSQSPAELKEKLLRSLGKIR